MCSGRRKLPVPHIKAFHLETVAEQRGKHRGIIAEPFAKVARRRAGLEDRKFHTGCLAAPRGQVIRLHLRCARAFSICFAP